MQEVDNEEVEQVNEKLHILTINEGELHMIALQCDCACNSAKTKVTIIKIN